MTSSSRALADTPAPRSRSGVRPFGVSLLVAGFDNARGHTLYQVDPSGSFWAWKASAIGKNQTNAKTFLEKRCVPCSSSCQALALPPLADRRVGWLTQWLTQWAPPRRYNDDLSLEDAIHTALLTLKEGFEGVMDEKTIEIGVITTSPTEEGVVSVGHGTGLKGQPGFRKLSEAEVAECVLLPLVLVPDRSSAHSSLRHVQLPAAVRWRRCAMSE